MEKILLASGDHNANQILKQLLADKYQFSAISTQQEYAENLSNTDFIILDQDFTGNHSLDFLSQVLNDKHLPILFLSSPGDATNVKQAMLTGAYSFIVKSEGYEKVLPLAVTEGIRCFNEQKLMLNTIEELKLRIEELKSKMTTTVVDTTSQEHTSAEDKINNKKVQDKITEQNLLNKVVQILKTGEIILPAFPAVCIEFRELIHKEADISRIKVLLEKDAAISSKMISVANSPLYRGMSSIKTLAQAISRIGISETENYVEIITNRSLYISKNTRYASYLKELWFNSLATAFASKEICHLLKRKNSEEVFTMGLFQNIGKLLLVQLLTKLENSQAREPVITETNAFSFINKFHGQFGEFLIKRWELGEEHALIARYAHDIENYAEPSDFMYIVNLAKRIADALRYGEAMNEENELEDCHAAQVLEISAEQIDSIFDLVSEAMKAGTVF